jgi:serine/threonine protein kinase
MAETDVTLKDTASESPTIRESAARSDSEATLVYGAPVWAGASGVGNSFRGWNIIEQLPTKGAEADIFIAGVSGERRILKLYRHKLEPKIEILNRITNISRENSHCFVAYYETGFDETTGRWYELQEYIENGSVKDLSWDVKRSQNFVAQFIPELTTAIQCLHDNGIIHCDLKPANVLVRTLEPLDLVLADFGISSLIASDMSQKMTSLKGTPMYWAPEAFSRVIGRACDWWGFGMMLLEMLLGEHPFEGLNDSQIIRKLTIGNVDVPEILGPDWNLLVKGLLTKDDAKRWGKSEIDRWLAGERNIPVFYESGEISERQYQTKPFRVSGIDCHSAREIAEAIAGLDEPWIIPGDYLRFIRQWYESNLMFDDASVIAGLISKNAPDVALFRFVHSNASLPFRVFGREADLKGLRGILSRVASGRATEADMKAAGMLDNGGLAAFYSEYASFGKTDAVFLELLDFLAKKPLPDQLGYTGAMCEPGEYIWPEDAETATSKGRLDFIKSLPAPPLPKKYISDIAERYVIPDSLYEMLRAGAAYAAGAAKLEIWKRGELMIERGGDEAALKNLSTDGYERTARVRNYRHAESVMREIDSLAAKIESLNFINPAPAFTYTLQRFAHLRDNKITDRDLSYIDILSELFARRDEIKAARWANDAIWGAIAGMTLGAARFVLGMAGAFSDAQFAFASVMLVLISTLFFAASGGLLYDWFKTLVDETSDNPMPRGYRGRGRYRGRGDNMGPAGFFSAMTIGLLLYFIEPATRMIPPATARMMSLAFPLSGAPIGACAMDMFQQYRIKNNLDDITSACDEYSSKKIS